MKQIGALLIGCAFVCQQPEADQFVLRGTIPGVMDSTKVSLSFNDRGGNAIEGYVIGGKFEIRGEVDEPKMGYLTVNDVDVCQKAGVKHHGYRRVNFFVENGEFEVTLPDMDSLSMPPRFMMYDMSKEANFEIKGSLAQNTFAAWQKKTLLLRYALYRAERKYYDTRKAEAYRAWESTKAELEKVMWEYIRGERNLQLRLIWVEYLKRNPFRYDQAYLDELAGLFANDRDTCASLKNFKAYLKEAAAFVKGMPVPDVQVTTPEGKTVALRDQLKPNGYTLIDFWASYCGPCRASFPHLREMHEQYGKKVKIINVSSDSEQEGWLKALEEEKLSWPQFRCGKEVRKAFNVMYIPTFVLVNADGKVVYWGGSSAEMGALLETL